MYKKTSVPQPALENDMDFVMAVAELDELTSQKTKVEKDLEEFITAKEKFREQRPSRKNMDSDILQELGLMSDDELSPNHELDLKDKLAQISNTISVVSGKLKEMSDEILGHSEEQNVEGSTSKSSITTEAVSQAISALSARLNTVVSDLKSRKSRLRNQYLVEGPITTLYGSLENAIKQKVKERASQRVENMQSDYTRISLSKTELESDLEKLLQEKAQMEELVSSGDDPDDAEELRLILEEELELKRELAQISWKLNDELRKTQSHSEEQKVEESTDEEYVGVDYGEYLEVEDTASKSDLKEGESDLEDAGVDSLKIFNEISINRSKRTIESPKPQWIKMNDLKNIKVIGSGHFGITFKAMMGKKTVVIKAPKGDPSREEMAELAILMTLKHDPNVLSMYAICANFSHQSLKEDCPAVVVPYQKHGDLKHFLVQYGDLSEQDATNIVLGMARGIQHLHENNIVHRDIALRNFLVSSEGRILVSDFGLSRTLESGKFDEYDSEYYRFGVEAAVPWRSSSPETLTKHKSTKESDMWMFGISIWEMYNLKQVPFPHIHNSNALIAEIYDPDFELSLSGNAPKLLSEIVKKCCQRKASERMTIQNVIIAVTGMEEKTNDGECLSSGDADWPAIMELLNDAEDNEPPLINEQESRRFFAMVKERNEVMPTVFNSCKSVQDSNKRLKRFIRNLKRMTSF